MSVRLPFYSFHYICLLLCERKLAQVLSDHGPRIYSLFYLLTFVFPEIRDRLKKLIDFFTIKNGSHQTLRFIIAFLFCAISSKIEIFGNSTRPSNDEKNRKINHPNQLLKTLYAKRFSVVVIFCVWCYKCIGEKIAQKCNLIKWFPICYGWSGQKQKSYTVQPYFCFCF